MSEVPKREQWWWSADEMRRAGWCLVRCPLEGIAMMEMWSHPDLGMVRALPNEHRTGEGDGAWRTEAPPPQPDEALHEIARRLFPRQSRRCMVHAGSDNPFRVDVKNDFGETAVSTRKPTREQAALALLCAYIEDHNGLHLVEHVHNVDRRGSHYELRFVRVAKVGQSPHYQTCVASTLDELIDEVVAAVERLAAAPLTDDEVRNISRRLRELAEQKPPGHPDRKDIEYAASVVDHALGWDCRREHQPHEPREDRLHRAIRRRPR